MAYIVVWIVQLLVFFIVVSSVASIFVKSGKSTAHHPDARQGGDEVEAPKRNIPEKSVKNNRPVRTQREKREQYQRFDRKRSSESVMKDVVTLSSAKKAKRKSNTVTFNKRNLKQAIVYKEILDKPISMRESE